MFVFAIYHEAKWRYFKYKLLFDWLVCDGVPITGLSEIVQVMLAAGLDGKDEQLAVNSSPMRYVVLGEVINGESLGGTIRKNITSYF